MEAPPPNGTADAASAESLASDPRRPGSSRLRIQAASGAEPSSSSFRSFNSALKTSSSAMALSTKLLHNLVPEPLAAHHRQKLGPAWTQCSHKNVATCDARREVDYLST